jgi:hypothetical protein
MQTRTAEAFFVAMTENLKTTVASDANKENQNEHLDSYGN